MENPFLAFSVDSQNQLVIRHHRDPQKGRFFQMEIPLTDLQEKGLDDAAKAIGILTLDLLAMWYPQQFSEFSVLKPPSAEIPNE